MLATLVLLGVLPFTIGSGLRLAPRVALPWGGPAARLLGRGLRWCRFSPSPLAGEGRGEGLWQGSAFDRRPASPEKGIPCGHADFFREERKKSLALHWYLP